LLFSAFAAAAFPWPDHAGEEDHGNPVAQAVAFSHRPAVEISVVHCHLLGGACCVVKALFGTEIEVALGDDHSWTIAVTLFCGLAKGAVCQVLVQTSTPKIKWPPTAIGGRAWFKLFTTKVGNESHSKRSGEHEH